MGSDLLKIGRSLASGATVTDMADSAIDSSPLNLIPGVSGQAKDLVKKNASAINGFFAPFMKFFSEIGTWILGIFDALLGMFDSKHVAQKPALEESLSKIDTQDSQFNKIATQLGLSTEFSKTLEADVKNATRSAFGMTGLSGKTEDATTSITDLQATLTEHIYNALIAKDGTLTEEAGKATAAKAASAITGLNLNGPIDNLATRFNDKKSRPTQGFGGFIFELEDQITNKAPTITAPNFTLAAPQARQ